MKNTSTLDNQLKVITEKVPGARSVAIGILVGAGPQDESEDKTGLAHLTEHGYFLGTSTRDSRAISRLVDESGGAVGAFTSRDYTCFYAHVMQDYAPFAWELLGDILLNSTFPEDRILQEREIVLQEIGIAHDQPQTRLNDLVKRSIWPKHPLGRPVGGDPDAVAALTREDVIYFAHQNYMPDRMVIAAVGNVEHEDVVESVTDAFWRMLGTSRSRAESPCDFESTVLIQNSNVSHTYFTLALPALNFTAPSRFCFHALSNLLCGGMSSRLFTRLREDLGIVYDIGASYDAYRAAGTLMLEGVTAAENLPIALTEVMQEIARLAEEGVDEEELHRTKLLLIGQHQLASDSLHTRMSRLLTQQFYFGKTMELESVLESIQSLTADCVQGCAQQMLAADRLALGVIGPNDDALDVHQIEEIMSKDYSHSCVF